MKQVLQDRQAGRIRIVEVPAPALLPGGLLVATRASLISTGTERSTVQLGSKSLLGKARARPDLARKVLDSVRSKGLMETFRTVQARLAEPSVLGYSAAGVVLEVGRGVEGFSAGDRVACAGQGFASHAEVNFVPRNLVVRLPDGLDFEEGAFVALGAIALHGVRTGGVVVGDHVAVVGLGLVGLLTVQLLKAAGCVVYGQDLLAARAELAKELGADVAVTAADELEGAVSEGSSGRGADAVLLTASTASNEPIGLAGTVARDRGTVCVVGDVGLDVPREVYYRKELALHVSRSYGPGRYDPAYEVLGQRYPVGFVPWDQQRNMEAFLRMVADGQVRIEPLVDTRFPLEQAPDAYQRIATSPGTGTPPVAVVLTYPEVLPPLRPSAVRVRAPVRPGRGIAVIGAGNFAQATLLPRVAKAPNWRRLIVVTTSGPSARTAADHFGFERAGTNVDEALTDPDTGAVVIATRHDSHAPLTVRAIRAGLPVFVEKPLAISLEELQDVMVAVRESGNDRILVGFNRRFSALSAAMQAHFPGGTQAVSYRVNAGPLPADHWTRIREEGGGRIIGEGCHFIDLITFLTRSMVEEVYAAFLPPVDGGMADTAQITLRYRNGAVGHVCYVAVGDPRMPKERVEAFGHGRAAVLDNFRSLELWRGGNRTREKTKGRVDKGFDAEVRLFFEACRNPETPMPIPFDALVNTTLATLAAERSLAEGRAIRLGELSEEAAG